MGFSPDGNFPIVNGEKGIVKFELIFPTAEKNLNGEYEIRKLVCGTTENYVCGDLELQFRYQGRDERMNWHAQKRALSRNPQRGENVLWELAKYFQGKSLVQPELEQMVHFLNECLTGDFYGKKRLPKKKKGGAYEKGRRAVKGALAEVGGRAFQGHGYFRFMCKNSCN